MTLPPGSYAPLVEEFVAELVVSQERSSPNVIIAEAVKKFPNAPALETTFAFTCVASALERPMVLPKDMEESFIAGLYRAIAVFSADIYAVERLRGPRPTCSNIQEFWAETSEEFFAGQSQKKTTCR